MRTGGSESAPWSRRWWHHAGRPAAAVRRGWDGGQGRHAGRGTAVFWRWQAQVERSRCRGAVGVSDQSPSALIREGALVSHGQAAQWHRSDASSWRFRRVLPFPTFDARTTQSPNQDAVTFAGNAAGMGLTPAARLLQPAHEGGGAAHAGGQARPQHAGAPARPSTSRLAPSPWSRPAAEAPPSAPVLALQDLHSRMHSPTSRPTTVKTQGTNSSEGGLRTTCVQGAAQAGSSPMARAIGQQIRACARPCAWGLTDSKSDTVISLLRTLFKNAPTTIRANGIYDRMYLTWATGRTWPAQRPTRRPPRALGRRRRNLGRCGAWPHDPCRVLPGLALPAAHGRCWALCVRCSAVLGVMLPGGESGKCAPKQSRALDCD